MSGTHLRPGPALQASAFAYFPPSRAPALGLYGRAPGPKLPLGPRPGPPAPAGPRPRVTAPRVTAPRVTAPRAPPPGHRPPGPAPGSPPPGHRPCRGAVFHRATAFHRVGPGGIFPPSSGTRRVREPESGAPL